MSASPMTIGSPGAHQPEGILRFIDAGTTKTPPCSFVNSQGPTPERSVVPDSFTSAVHHALSKHHHDDPIQRRNRCGWYRYRYDRIETPDKNGSQWRSHRVDHDDCFVGRKLDGLFVPNGPSRLSCSDGKNAGGPTAAPSSRIRHVFVVVIFIIVFFIIVIISHERLWPIRQFFERRTRRTARQQPHGGLHGTAQ
jgi:hypothetical protein